MANKETGAEKPVSGLLGSLRDVLKAASREEEQHDAPAAKAKSVAATSPLATQQTIPTGGVHMPPSDDNKPEGTIGNAGGPPPVPATPSAADAAREARGGTPNIPPVDAAKATPGGDGAPPTTRVVRETPAGTSDDAPKTQLVRGRQPVERGDFSQDPVVGWLVVVGGPGIGSYRPIFEGNNTVGRNSSNRVPVDFGDDAISGDEQAYIRYDSADRSFLLVPNLSKTNVVAINDKRPTSAVPLRAMDVIAMGRTQLVFVPFCGPEFDWGELSGLKT